MKNLFLLALLILIPRKFFEIATNDVVKKEFKSNKQLLENYPDQKLPQEKRLEFFRQIENSSLKLRTSIINSFKSIAIVVLSAFLLAKFLNFLGVPASKEIINLLRLISICLIFWSVWGKLGWEIQTWDGETLPEMINKNWSKSLYLSGVFIGILTCYL